MEITMDNGEIVSAVVWHSMPRGLYIKLEFLPIWTSQGEWVCIRVSENIFFEY